MGRYVCSNERNKETKRVDVIESEYIRRYYIKIV